MKQPAPPKSNHYVSNIEFYAAMKDYKQACREAAEQGLPKPKIPKYIGECLYKIANKLSYRPNFINYSYRDEMIADGLENCITYFDNFNPDKSNNPFSYFTQIIYYAFLRRIQKEKKQVYVKHKVYHQQMVDGAMHHLQEGNSGEDFDVAVMEDTEQIPRPPQIRRIALNDEFNAQPPLDRSESLSFLFNEGGQGNSS